MADLPTLTREDLCNEASSYTAELSGAPLADLYGVTDGKKVGTYVEADFRTWIQDRYTSDLGNAAKGIDFPDIEVDLKVTSIAKPQSSCPFREASQKIYGLGYHLLVFVYDKTDDAATETAVLDIRNALFVDKAVTADHQTTKGILEILAHDGNAEDLAGFFADRGLPGDEVAHDELAQRVLAEPPSLGFLTMSNAFQWRLAYSRAITRGVAGDTPGLTELHA